jgi:hypothetical protein
VSPVKYELCFYISGDSLHNGNRIEDLKSDIAMVCLLQSQGELTAVDFMLCESFSCFRY